MTDPTTEIRKALEAGPEPMTDDEVAGMFQYWHNEHGTTWADLIRRIEKQAFDKWSAHALTAHDRLCAEVEALRKDAERYRWLRERNALLGDHPIFTAIRVADPDTGRFDYNDLIAGDEMDAAIDAAASLDASDSGEGGR